MSDLLNFCHCGSKHDEVNWHVVNNGEPNFDSLCSQLEAEYNESGVKRSREYIVDYFVTCSACGGFIDWVSVYDRAIHSPNAQNRVNGVIVNPVQRLGFNSTPHYMRSRTEYFDWVDLLFIVNEGDWWIVKKLDYNCHDRPSDKGRYKQLDDAISAIKLLEAK